MANLCGLDQATAGSAAEIEPGGFSLLLQPRIQEIEWSEAEVFLEAVGPRKVSLTMRARIGNDLGPRESVGVKEHWSPGATMPARFLIAHTIQDTIRKSVSEPERLARPNGVSGFVANFKGTPEYTVLSSLHGPMPTEGSGCYHAPMFNFGRPATPGQWIGHILLGIVALFLIWWLIRVFI